jgi:hypothetical protein
MLEHDSAFCRIVIATDDVETMCLGVFGNCSALVVKRILLLVRGHAKVLDG